MKPTSLDYKRAFRALMWMCLALVGLSLVGFYVPPVHHFLWGDGGITLAALAPFTVEPDLQAIAIAYRNRNLIGDSVLPRLIVAKQTYKYYLWDKAEGFTIPDTKVGRTSAPNQVQFSATDTESTTTDYGLDDPIPQADLDNAPTGIDPRGRAAEGITDLILLDREKRIADKVFVASAYATANKETLSGTAQISDYTNSDPIGKIAGALDVPIVRPNVMVLGQAVWTKLRGHPDIIKAVNATAGDTGLASRQAVAELFELEEILVGQSRLNTAKKGQTASYSNVWGKHLLLMLRDSLANPAQSASRVTFGFTAQFGMRIAGVIQDPDLGARGGQRIRVAESVDEHIVAADVAYFFEDAVA